MTKITIFGLIGTGTSSVGKLLAKELNYQFLSSGEIFRQKAKDLNLNLLEFEQLCKQDSKYDKDLDNEIKFFGESHDNFVVESRLAWFFIPDSLKIKLTCETDERIKRVSKRDNISIEEAKNTTLLRDRNDIERYQAFYSIKDFAPNNAFDIVIDTTNISIEEIVLKIKDFISKEQ